MITQSYSSLFVEIRYIFHSYCTFMGMVFDPLKVFFHRGISMWIFSLKRILREPIFSGHQQGYRLCPLNVLKKNFKRLPNYYYFCVESTTRDLLRQTEFFFLFFFSSYLSNLCMKIRAKLAYPITQSHFSFISKGLSTFRGRGCH